MLQTKTHIFIGLLIGALVLGVSVFSREIGYCPSYSYSVCAAFFDQVAEIFLPIIPALCFAGILFFFSNQVYQAWFKFARWWIPLSMLLILISPQYSRDFLYPIEKGSVLFVTSVIFIVVSSLIIAIKALRKK